MVHAPPIDRLRQYGRSRMRICRGWAVNAVLIAVPANAYAAQHVASPGSTLLLIDVILGVTFLGTLLSWRTLTHSEYRKIRGGAAFLRSELGLPPLAGAEAEPLPATAPGVAAAVTGVPGTASSARGEASSVPPEPTSAPQAPS